MKHRFAIVGCGRIAIKHAEQINRLGKLIAVCDLDLQKAEALGNQFHATAFSSMEEMLSMETGIEVVSICTPNYLHAKQSIFALQSGKNVLCEKPMAINVSDAKRMIETSLSCQRKLFIVKSTRYTPCINALKQVIENNKLGQVYSFQLNCLWNRPDSYYTNSWKGTMAQDGGTLFTQFSHYIDVLLWLLNDEVDDVKGFRSNLSKKNIEFEDTGAFAIKMKSGSLGSLHYSVNAFQKNQEVSLTIVAEKGTLKIGGEYMNELIYQQPDLIDLSNLSANNLPNEYESYKGSMSNHDKVYENLINALDGNESNFTDGEAALKSVELIEKIYLQKLF